MNDKNKKAFERAKEKLKKIALAGAVAAPLFAGGKANAQSVTQNQEHNQDVVVTENKGAARIHNIVYSFQQKDDIEYKAFENESGYVKDWSNKNGTVNLFEAKDGSLSEYRFTSFGVSFYCDARSGEAYTYTQNGKKESMSSEKLNEQLSRFAENTQLKSKTYVIGSKDYSR